MTSVVEGDALTLTLTGILALMNIGTSTLVTAGTSTLTMFCPRQEEI